MRLFSFAGKQLASVDAAGLHNHMAAVSPDGRFFAAATFTSDVKVTCAMLSCMHMSLLHATSYCEPLLGAAHYCEPQYLVTPVDLSLPPPCFLCPVGSAPPSSHKPSAVHHVV